MFLDSSSTFCQFLDFFPRVSNSLMFEIYQKKMNDQPAFNTFASLERQEHVYICKQLVNILYESCIWIEVETASKI